MGWGRWICCSQMTRLTLVLVDRVMSVFLVREVCRDPEEQL